MDCLIPYTTEHMKKRIGSLHDGGYVICDLSTNYDCFISGGIFNDITFEQAFLDMYSQIPCFAFDGTISKLPWEDSRIQFIKKI